MAEMKFETGLVDYEINGVCTVRINPTDSEFVEKLFDCFTDLDKKQMEYRDEIEKCGDKQRIFEIARNRDREMRVMIDGILGEGICDKLFGSMNVYALADGLPVWCNLMLAVMDECDSAFAREQMRTNPRITKYTGKHSK